MMHRVKEEIINDDDCGSQPNHNHNNSTPPSSSQANHHSAIVIKKEEEEKDACTFHHNNHLEFINCENCLKVSQSHLADDDDKTKIALTYPVKRECIKSEYDVDCGCNDCLHAKNAAASTSTFANTVHQINDSNNVNDCNQQKPHNHESERDNLNYEDHDFQNDFSLALDLDTHLNRRRSTRSEAKKLKINAVVESSSDSSTESSNNSTSSSSNSELEKPIRKRTTSNRKTKSPVFRKPNAKGNTPKKNQVTITNPESDDGTREENEEAEECTKQSLFSKIVVVSLKCWLCDHLGVNKKKLEVHLLEKHKLKQYRCLMHECGFSTHHNVALTNHRKTAHADLTTNWPCAQCSQKPNSYAKLRIHFKHFHQQGTFRCGFDDCDFTPTTSRRDVKNHLAAVHRCPVESCARLYNQDALKKHRKRAHSKQPKRDPICHRERFHCRWHKCSYRMDKLEDVLVHVRNSHFKDGDKRDPGDFVEKRDAPRKSTKSELNSFKPQKDVAKDNKDQNRIHKETEIQSNIRAITISLRCWLCKRSDRAFNDKFELNDHLLVVHGVERFRCVAWACGASFFDRDQLNHHLESEHKDTRIWSCDKCRPSKHKKRFFPSYAILARHIHDSHQYGHFKCAVDDCTFESNGACNRITFCAHFDEAHLVAKFACWHCDQMFKDKEELACHERDHNTEKDTMDRPDNQGKTNRGISESNTEDKSDTSSSESNYDQSEAKRKKDIIERVKHKTAAVSGTTKPIKRAIKDSPAVLTVRLNCPIDGCTEHRPDKSELNAHLLEAHEVKKNRCLVKDCLANFRTNFQYSKHLEVMHKKVDGYQCGKCDYFSKKSTLLFVHNNVYHEEGIFRCSHPGCDFVSHTNRQKVHGHQYQHKPLRYKCTHTGCDQAFRESKSLKNHLKNHEKGMFEGCPHCGRHFARLDLFKKHLLSHSKTKAKLQDGFLCCWSGCKYFASFKHVLKEHLIEQHFAGDPKYGKITDRIEMIRAVKSFTKVIRAKK